MRRSARLLLHRPLALSFSLSPALWRTGIYRWPRRTVDTSRRFVCPVLSSATHSLYSRMYRIKYYGTQLQNLLTLYDNWLYNVHSEIKTLRSCVHSTLCMEHREKCIRVRAPRREINLEKDVLGRKYVRPGKMRDFPIHCFFKSRSFPTRCIATSRLISSRMTADKKTKLVVPSLYSTVMPMSTVDAV